MATQVQSVRAAVVQAAPVAFDRERTLEKVRTLTAGAASQGVQIVVFPEAFVSAYPRGLTFGAVVGNRTPEGREQYRCYWESAVDVPGPAVDVLADIARHHQVYLVIGVIERDGGTLYCTVLFFSADGRYLGKRWLHSSCLRDPIGTTGSCHLLGKLYAPAAYDDVCQRDPALLRSDCRWTR